MELAIKLEMNLIVHDYLDTELKNINKKYICSSHYGLNLSPKISWSKVDNAISYALIMEDLDATFNEHNYIHWFIPYIENTITVIDSGNYTSNITINQYKSYIQNNGNRSNNHSLSILMGFNDSGTYGYFGPCAPTGVHKYQFTIYALNGIYPISGDKCIKGYDDFRRKCLQNGIKILGSSSKIFLYGEK